MTIFIKLLIWIDEKYWFEIQFLSDSSHLFLRVRDWALLGTITRKTQCANTCPWYCRQKQGCDQFQSIHCPLESCHEWWNLSQVKIKSYSMYCWWFIYPVIDSRASNVYRFKAWIALKFNAEENLSFLSNQLWTKGHKK